VGLSLAGLDLTNWEWTPEHIAQTLLDAVGFIPVIGSLKYADVARKFPELVELARDMGKLDDVLGSADEFGELLESAPEMVDLLNNTDKAAQLFDSADEFISGAGESNGILSAGSKAAAIKSVDELPPDIQPKVKNFFKGGSNSYTDFSVNLMKDGSYVVKMTKPGNFQGQKQSTIRLLTHKEIPSGYIKRHMTH